MLTRDESIPSKSVAYLYGQSIFYDQFNDINFFVEDADQEQFYFAILKNLFPEVRIDKIFPLGGKENVLQHCKDNGVNSRSIYIVDKDFDDLLNKKENIRNLFYLCHHCIENYLLEENAFIRFIVSERPKLKDQSVKTQLNFGSILNQATDELRYLFVLFFIIQDFELPLKNTSLKPEVFCCDHKMDTIDFFKLCKLRKEVNTHAIASGKCADINDQLVDLLVNHFNNDDLLLNISGKHILHLLFHRLKKEFKISSMPIESFCFRLAEYCRFDSLRYLKEMIEDFRVSFGVT